MSGGGHSSPQQSALSENKGGGLVIDGDRFGLPLGFCVPFSAETRSSGKQAGYYKKSKLEYRP